MRISHIVPGMDEIGNGIAVAVRLIADRQRADGHDVTLVETQDFVRGGGARNRGGGALAPADEIWVHSMWLPETIRACREVLAAGVPLVRMPHGCLDPQRLAYGRWKKRLVGALFERSLFNRASRIVVTCAAEENWVRAFAPSVRAVECVDLKRCFGIPLGRGEAPRLRDGVLHILYLGRRHPLKGIAYLEESVRQLNDKGPAVELRIVSGHTGAALEADWTWCDVLCLPTLSENFGIVVAEARARGVFVVTTDGAPAWSDLKSDEGVYIRGYVAASPAERVQMLVKALGVLTIGDERSVKLAKKV